MKQNTCIAGFLLFTSALVAAPTENDPNTGLQISYNTAINAVNVDWFALESNYYFLMETTDLVSTPWAYFPYAVLGSHGVEGVEVQMPASRMMFFKIAYTDDESSTLLTSDFDNDGISNGDELRSRLNIYDDSDLNGDGVSDDWESFFGANIDSSDNDGDGWTNLEEHTMGTNPNVVNLELAPPTLELQGDYSTDDGIHSILDDGKIAAYINTKATIGVTHYRVEGSLLPPKIVFNGSSTEPVSLPTEPAQYEPRATGASVLTADNGIYTIAAKTYAEIDGVLHESAVSTFTIKIRPYESDSVQGTPKYSRSGVYDIVSGYWHTGSLSIPEDQRRYVSDGWFLEPVTGVTGAYERYIPDFTSITSNINTYLGIAGYSTSSSPQYFGVTDPLEVRSFGHGWITGPSFYTDFSNPNSRSDYFVDKRDGTITDRVFDIDAQYRENLGRGWLTGDGFLPDRTHQYNPADDVYFDRFAGRLTYDQPSILDPDEDLGKGWIAGWASHFSSEESVKDTDLDLLADSIASAYTIPVDPSSPGPKDSDGDGRYDFEEIYVGGNPIDTLDIFPAANSFFASSESLIPIIFTVGDPSGSHSEQWELQISRLSDQGIPSLVETIRADLGTLASRIFSVPAGVGHSITLNHIRGQGDFDYTFTAQLGSGAPTGSGIVISDPNGITGTYNNVSLASVSGVVTVTPPKACLKGPTGERLAAGVGSSGRTEVFFEAGPLQGPGSFVLSQNNSKIQVWDSPSGGNLVTTPAQPVKQWSLGSTELVTLVTGKRLWIEGLQTSSTMSDTKLGLKYLDNSGNPVGEVSTLEITLLDLDLIGHQPGPGGAPISESLEDDPTSLMLNVNNDFDEGRVNAQGAPITDSERPANGIDTALDPDFFKVTINLPDTFNGSDGTFELYAQSIEDVRRLPMNAFLNVYTSDGITELSGDDFELDVSHPQGPLAELISNGSISLLVEVTQGIHSKFRLCARYKPNVGNVVFEDKLSVTLLKMDLEASEYAPQSVFISASGSNSFPLPDQLTEPRETSDGIQLLINNDDDDRNGIADVSQVGSAMASTSENDTSPLRIRFSAIDAMTSGTVSIKLEKTSGEFGARLWKDRFDKNSAMLVVAQTENIETSVAESNADIGISNPSLGTSLKEWDLSNSADKTDILDIINNNKIFWLEALS